jgi:AcrR family transcriptional regulator
MIKSRSRSARKGSDPVPEVDGEKLKDRRKTIVAALRRCMLTKGYAETRLTDLARAAGISVSHLLYYFESKEAVLEEVCEEVVDQTLTEVTSYRDDPPEERIHILVDHVFVRSVISRSELGVVLELVALSMHRSKIREKLDRYNREMMAYLTDLFQQVPRQPGVSAREAADIAAAIWMGLVTNSQYDSGLDDGRARRLFRRSLFDLANIRNSESPASLSNVSHGKSRSVRASA